jgi:acetyl esterase/lipase
VERGELLLKRSVLFAAAVAVIFLISMTGCGNRTVTSASVQSESEQIAQVQKAESSNVQTITSKGSDKEKVKHNNVTQEETQISANPVTENTTVSEIINAPVFGDFGRLLFPVDRTVTGDMTLADISSSNVYVWYSDIKKEKTVEIVNDLKSRAENGETIFYPIYSEREMASNPSKKSTGLFFFKGEPGAKFAVMNAGGGFMYVGAMHDSFPHALEVSKKGYNAFALIYRPDDPYTDLARAIAFIYDNAKELEVDPEGYSLWGGSAGARMAAALGNSDSMAAYGRPDIPQAAAVIMQYTGYSTASGKDAPTYACVGTNDGIASWRTMQSRLKTLDSYGIPTEFHAYKGLSHGFGLGTGTVADGWINDAVAFWEHQM